MRTNAILITLVLTASVALGQAKTTLYTNPECGMQFQLPANWVVTASQTAGKAGTICTLNVEPVDLQERLKDAGGVDVYSLTVVTTNATLDAAAADDIFEKRGTKWIAMGRQNMESEAKRISGANWTGITATASVGCYGPQGYAGLCDNPRAVLNDGKNTSAIIDGGPQDEDAFERILKTFRFLPRKDTYQGDEQWEEVCKKALTEPLQQPNLTGPLLTAQLEKCDEAALYYGFVEAPSYPAALQCGWYQRVHPRETEADLFYGPGVLSMLYANGFGVERDYNLAIRFACEDKWTGGTEQELRIGHLEHLRDTKAVSTTFDLCDDITSGRNQGACADIASRKKDAARDRKLDAIQASLPPAARELFPQLQQAESAFEESRVNTEIDLTGTARAMFQINDETKLRDQFVINLEHFQSNGVPSASKEDVAKLDRQLNDVYRSIEDSPRDAWSNTTVRPEGIRDTERKWINLQDAWMKFAAVAYPKLSPERVRAQLIRLRLHQLRSLAPRD